MHPLPDTSLVGGACVTCRDAYARRATCPT